MKEEKKHEEKEQNIMQTGTQKRIFEQLKQSKDSLFSEFD
jgi:hypothetical protein